MDDDASTRDDEPEATDGRSEQTGGTDAESTPAEDGGTDAESAPAESAPADPTTAEDGQSTAAQSTAEEATTGAPSDDGEAAGRPGTEPGAPETVDETAADAGDAQAVDRRPDSPGDGEAPGDAAETDAADADDAAETDAADADDGGPAETDSADSQPAPSVPEDVRKYDRFQKMDGAQYDRVNEFLRERTYVTAREWAMARLCADFRTETGVEMTKIGENLPELVPFMTDEYSPQAVNQARASFEEKVRKAGATFLYGAMSDFFTADELDDLMYEVTEVAKFLLEVEGVDLSVEEELEAEERISSVMREVRRSSDALRHDGLECPNCGHEIETGE